MSNRRLYVATLALVAATLSLSGCVTMARNYKPAGFDSASEARPYVRNYLYFASKLTAADWDAFYRRFPEYFKDIHVSKMIGGTMDLHPWYVAYAFRWTTLQRRETWPADVQGRLAAGQASVGDDVFQAIYAKGVPARIMWDNDVDALLYKPGGVALIMENSRVVRIATCMKCIEADRRNALRLLQIEAPVY